MATRMVHDGTYKLIYYPVGHQFHLFDMKNDPDELHDLSSDSTYTSIMDHLTGLLKSRLYGTDLDWVVDNELVGLPEPDLTDDFFYNPSLGNARGYRIR